MKIIPHFSREYLKNSARMRLAGLDKSKFLRYDMEDGGNYPLGWDTVFDNKKLAICGKSCKIKKW
jgi:hypothetical protein